MPWKEAGSWLQYRLPIRTKIGRAEELIFPLISPLQRRVPGSRVYIPVLCAEPCYGCARGTQLDVIGCLPIGIAVSTASETKNALLP